MEIISGARTDIGIQRKGNEDSYACADELGLYLVADGMGGHVAGEIASSAAADTIVEYVRSRLDEGDTDRRPQGDTNPLVELSATGVREANRSVHRLGRENPKYAGLGTTVTGMMIRGEKACVFHVGDSRLYRLRDGEFKALTTDHSWVNEQLRRNIITPEEARNHRLRNVITRAVGTRPEVEVDAFETGLRPGDCFLLCTDGLTSEVDDEEIRKVLVSPDRNPDDTCRRLIDMANEAGGTDNITVIILRVRA